MRSNRQSRREAKRLFRTCFVGGALADDLVRRTVHDVAAAGARDRRAILGEFSRLVKLHLAERTAAVESATVMPDDLRAELAAALERRYGPGLETIFAEQPSLIGGVRIRVGSYVYDGTVLARLQALDRSF